VLNARLALALFCAAPLATTGCVTPTAGNVQLRADQAFLTAQIAFKSLQQIALAGVKSGAISGATKARVIALVNEGQRYENEAYATRSATSLAGLTGTVKALSDLGIGKD